MKQHRQQWKNTTLTKQRRSNKLITNQRTLPVSKKIKDDKQHDIQMRETATDQNDMKIAPSRNTYYGCVTAVPGSDSCHRNVKGVSKRDIRPKGMTGVSKATPVTLT